MHINTENLELDVERLLYTEEQIAKRVAELGAQLTKDYAGKRPVVVCILRGACLFFTDLCRQMKLDVELDFIDVSSYGSGTQSSGSIRMIKDLDTDIEGRDVLLVEDIVDSGLTLKHLRQLLAARNPSSVKVCCLLNKKEAHPAELDSEYSGFDICNEFVVGYGLDYAEHYRNLPYIGVLKPEVYAK